jgi:hypothetical protein
MSRFIKKFRFTRSFEEGVRLKDRGLKILSVSRYDLFDLESLLAIFYTGYNKASVYPRTIPVIFYRTAFFDIQQHHYHKII